MFDSITQSVSTSDLKYVISTMLPLKDKQFKLCAIAIDRKRVVMYFQMIDEFYTQPDTTYDQLKQGIPFMFWLPGWEENINGYPPMCQQHFQFCSTNEAQLMMITQPLSVQHQPVTLKAPSFFIVIVMKKEIVRDNHLAAFQ